MNLPLFLVMWSIAAVVSALLVLNVISDQRSVYVSIAAVCYPVLIIAVVMELEIWHNRQVISVAITRGCSRLRIVCKPFFYLLLGHVIFYGVISVLFLHGGIGKFAIMQYALTQAGLTAWIILISVATDKRIVAATVVLIYFYFAAPFIPILTSDQVGWVNELPGFVRSLASILSYLLPPVWSVGGPVIRDSLMSAELLAKCVVSILLPMIGVIRLFWVKDI